MIKILILIINLEFFYGLFIWMILEINKFYIYLKLVFFMWINIKFSFFFYWEFLNCFKWLMKVSEILVDVIKLNRDFLNFV